MFFRVARNIGVTGGRLAARSPVLVKRRYFSEVFDPYPNTKSVRSGAYLVHAIEARDEKTIASILDNGIDPNFRADQNETPLMMAAENNMIDAVACLVKHGANVNLQDDLGETALMKASRESHKEVVKFLMENGAQADILNYEQMTARESTLDVEVDKMLSGEDKVEEMTVEGHATADVHITLKKVVEPPMKPDA